VGLVTALAGLAGAALAGGLLLLVVGVRGTLPRPPRPARARRVPAGPRRRRRAAAVTAGLGVAVATRWPVGAALAFVLGWWWPALAGGRAASQAAIGRVEAVAAWTEMLRDTMAAAAGLEQAITSTRPVAPEPIRAEVTALAARLADGREPLGAALRRFADEVADPSADRVVVSLLLASEQRAQRLGELLGALAAATREEVAMRLRVETERARTRASSRLIVAFTLALAGALVAFNRAYLRPFDSPVGQLVLAVVGLAFGAAFWWLAQLGRFEAPERFLRATPQPEGAQR